MTALQILAVVIAAVASACFFQTARLLGPDGSGWLGAHAVWRWCLDLLALFWLAAAVYALGHAAIVKPLTLILAVVCFKIAMLVLVINLRRRAPKASAGLKVPADAKIHYAGDVQIAGNLAARRPGSSPDSSQT